MSHSFNSRSNCPWLRASKCFKNIKVTEFSDCTQRQKNWSNVFNPDATHFVMAIRYKDIVNSAGALKVVIKNYSINF